MSHYRFQRQLLGTAMIVAGFAAATATSAWAFGEMPRGWGALLDRGETEEIIRVADDATRTIYDGVYTEEQAAAGREHYMSICMTCHENTARGGPGAPGLIAYTLNNKYADQPLFAYFDYMRQNMPPGQGGWFVDKEYAEIVAFLLQLHGAPAGETELPSDEEGLNAILIVPKP